MAQCATMMWSPPDQAGCPAAILGSPWQQHHLLVPFAGQDRARRDIDDTIQSRRDTARGVQRASAVDPAAGLDVDATSKGICRPHAGQVRGSRR